MSGEETSTNEISEMPCPFCKQPADILLIYFKTGMIANGCSKCNSHSDPIKTPQAWRRTVMKEKFGAWAGVA